MKKSELHKQIRETILSKLSKDSKEGVDEYATADDVKNQEELNKKLEKTKELQKDMGMAESKKKA